MLRAIVLAACVLAFTAAASAQNPVQWNSSARSAIARAQEQSLPLLFWVTERSDWDKEFDDLRDAQQETFRDPAVVSFIQNRFIPVRLSVSNSNVMKEAQSLGLPTQFGMYVAILAPDGKLLDQVGPEEVAQPERFAARIAAVSRKYEDDLYTSTLGPVIAALDAPKGDVRKAVQIVWRHRILIADKDLVALLGRADLTAMERSRLYSLFASFATPPCTGALLDRAAEGDQDAARALSRADAGALETLLPELPAADGEGATPRQLAAYRAACSIAKIGNPRPDTFWTEAKPDQRAAELERTRMRAQTVFDYWNDGPGKWR